MVLLCVMEQQM